MLDVYNMQYLEYETENSNPSSLNDSRCHNHTPPPSSVILTIFPHEPFPDQWEYVNIYLRLKHFHHSHFSVILTPSSSGYLDLRGSTGGWGKLHTEQIQNSLFINMGAMKNHVVKWAGHVVCLEEKSMHCVGRKPAGKRHSKDLSEDRKILKLDNTRKYNRSARTGFIWLQTGISGRPHVNTVMSLCVP